MLRKLSGLAAATALFISFTSTVALGCACQNKAGEANGSTFTFPAAVGWAPTVEAALKSAKEKNKPIAIYFASKEEFKVVGESPEVIKKYADENNNSMPTTVFDLPKLITHMRTLGIVEVVKIAVTKDNRDEVAKYEGAAHNLAILAPSGERIDGGSVIGAAMPKLAASAKTKIDAWQAWQVAQSK